VNRIVIDGGMITIHGDSNRAGIGVSISDTDSGSAVEEIEIKGGHVNVTGSIALGSTDGSVGSISIGGTSKVSIDCFSVSASSCMEAPSIQFGSSPIHFQVQNGRLLSASNFTIDDSSELLVEYRVVSEGEDLVNVPRLHIQSLPSGSTGAVTIGIVGVNSVDGVRVREFVFDTSQFVGFMVNLPASDYLVSASGAPLCASSSPIFAVSTESVLYSELGFCVTHTLATTPTASVATLPFTTRFNLVNLRPRIMLILGYLVNY
jgi:hypothetical protein